MNPFTQEIVQTLIPLLLVFIFSGFLFSACTSSEPVPTETINQEIQDERSSFDDKRGSTAEAAKTAQALIDLARITSPDTTFDVYIRTEADEADLRRYELGGNEQEYKNSISFAGVSIVIDSDVWSASTEDRKKNLVASWIKIMQNQYPNASGWLKVNNALRDVAEANWLKAEYGKSPDIKLQ